MLKILVTGGSGLIGSKIAGAAKNGYEVIPTHNTASLFLNSIKMDITDKDEVSRIPSEFKPDVVIHAAAGMPNVAVPCRMLNSPNPTAKIPYPSSRRSLNIVSVKTTLMIIMIK